MIRLSESQQAVVAAPIGQPLRVLASAGSGKTRVLTERIRFILEHSTRQGVIALTFTNKAAGEMAERLEDIEDLEDRCWIGTIHSIAQRILDQYGQTVGLPAELHIYEREQDRQTLFLESLRRNGIEVDQFLGIEPFARQKERDSAIYRYMERFAKVKRNLVSETDGEPQTDDEETFWTAFHAYQDLLLESGGIDFDDILVYAHKILLEQPWCGDIYRAKYKHVCVDEAQDLNKAQYEFIKVLCGETIRSVMFVGDPNQMIYGFNGSSSDYLCSRFVDDFAPRTYSLTENYRSSRAVVRLANKLADGSQEECSYAMAGRVEFACLPDERAEASWVADKIESLLEMGEHEEIEGQIGLARMVVIARTRYVFSALRECLDGRSIPFALNRGEHQAEPTSTVGRVLDLALRLHVNPKDWIHGKRLCSLLGLDECQDWEVPNALAEAAQQIADSSIPYREIQVELLTAVNELDLETPNFLGLCNAFEGRLTQLAEELEADADAELERSLEELRDVRDCWVRFRKKGLGDSLQAFRNAMALGQLAADDSPGGLTLSTVHTMKGLEKDIVFLIAMCEGVFPDYRAQTTRQVEEERNNAFVAITRARRWLYISYPESRTMPWGDSRKQYPSRFLDELDS